MLIDLLHTLDGGVEILIQRRVRVPFEQARFLRAELERLQEGVCDPRFHLEFLAVALEQRGLADQVLRIPLRILKEERQVGHLQSKQTALEAPNSSRSSAGPSPDSYYAFRTQWH